MAECSEAVRAELDRALGDMAAALEPPVRVAGSRLGVRIEPTDGDGLARALRALDTQRAPAVVRAGGSRQALGNPARGAQVLLSCAKLTGIHELDAADGVVQAGAGTPLAELERAVREHGWQVPLDPPGAATTLGGALASAALGPRSLGFGAARDCVLGLDTVLATGERTRCGGRVVKNVTGYDLAKLYVGSLGSLGVLERAWLRLRPAPRTTRVLVSPLRPDPDPHAIALQAARHSAARVVALVGSELAAAHMPGVGPSLDADEWLLVAEYAGDAEATREGAERLAEGRASTPADETSIDALRALQGHVAALGVRARLHVLPSQLRASCATLRAAAAQLLVYPGTGVVHAFFEPSGHGEEDPWWLDGVFAALERVRVEQRAQLVVEALPEWAHGRRDVFFGGGGPLSLMRRIKARFDPNGILNPGRFAGSI